MKTVLFAAAAVLALSAGTAFAGEGAGDPFPFRAPGVTTVTTGRAQLPGGLDDPFPFRADGTVMTQAVTSRTFPTNGAEGGIDSVNSLPAGSENGTAAYAQSQRVQQYLASRAARAPTQVAQR